MRQETIAIPDDLEQAIEEAIQEQPDTPTLSALTQAALREYLEERGYLRPRKVLRIRQASTPGGDPRASIEHDRHIADMHQ